MKLKSIFIAAMLATALSSHADAPPHGRERLRELVVFPAMDFQVMINFNFNGPEFWIEDGLGLPAEIARRVEELKKQPEDIHGLLQLAPLLNKNGQTNESQTCYRQCEQLCRKRLEIQPKNGLLLTYLGETLDNLDKGDEAASAYRQSVLVSSNEWRCWAALGVNLEQQSVGLVAPTNSHWQTEAQIPQEVLDFHPSLDAMKTSEEKDREAIRCFNRAFALAPREPEVYVQHVGFDFSSNLRNSLLRHILDNTKLDVKSMLSGLWSKACAEDFRKAADLKTKDYKLTGMAAYISWMNEAVNSGSPTNFNVELLSASGRKFIRDAMTKLENLSSDPDKKTAAGALENLGLLTVMFGGSQKSAADYLHRAVALEPERDQSWEGWFGSSVESLTLDELAVMCESRLKIRDSARNHIIYAKIFAKQRKWDKSAEQSEAALKLEPDNILAHLMLVALTLRQSSDENSLAPAVPHLTAAAELLKKLPDDEEKWNRTRELNLDWAIGLALSEGLSSQNAKDMIDSVLKAKPDDEDAKQIRRALE